jgi:TPR repeat protein
LYRFGCGVVPEDTQQELDWFLRAADHGNSMAAAWLGNYYDDRKTGDPAKAFRWYMQAAADHNAVAEFNVGSLYETGEGVERSDASAALWYRKALDHSQADPRDHITRSSFQALLRLYDRGTAIPSKSLEDNRKEGIAWLRLMADQDNGFAQLLLAQAYEHGTLGVARDDRQAFRWMSKAVEKEPHAQTVLGYVYRTGRGQPKDYPRALELLRKAAEGGDPQGQVNLASMYEEGKGVKKDYGEAFKWYLAAAGRFDAAGAYFLSKMYREGKGVPQDRMTALMYKLIEAYMKGVNFRHIPRVSAFPHILDFTWLDDFHPSQKDYEKASEKAKEWIAVHDCARP